jgi:hypothetical protein
MAEVRLQKVNCPAETSGGGNIAESGARPELWPHSSAIFKKHGHSTSKSNFKTNFKTNSKTNFNSNGSGQECPLHTLLLVVFLLFLFDTQVVGNGEDTRNAVGLHAGNLLVHGAGDHALQRDMTVLHYDVNGRDGA